MPEFMWLARVFDGEFQRADDRDGPGGWFCSGMNDTLRIGTNDLILYEWARDRCRQIIPGFASMSPAEQTARYRVDMIPVMG
jgi:hypothetical protein